MVAGLGVITFRLHDCRSLKGKRKIVKSIIARLRNNFIFNLADDLGLAEVIDSDMEIINI